MRSSAASLMSGPTSVALSRGSPTGSRPYTAARRSTSSSTIDVCAMTRRMLVQRCPAVPAAAKTIPRTARSRSALGATMAALLPPSSRRVLPKRAATRGPISAPMRSDPVALTSATRGSSSSGAALSRSVMTTWCTAAGNPASAMARSRIAEHASDVSGVSSDGFQMTVSPQTRATAVFQAQTAAGKLNAEMTATTPRGCHVSISRCPGRSDGIVRPSSWRDRPDGEVADVDHLLDLAEGLRADLPDLDGDQLGEVGLVLLEQAAELLDEGAARRRRDAAPGQERLVRPRDRLAHLRGVHRAQGDQVAPGDGGARRRAGAGRQGRPAGGERALGEGEQVGFGRHGRSLPHGFCGRVGQQPAADVACRQEGGHHRPRGGRPDDAAVVQRASAARSVTSTLVAPSSSLESAGRTTSSAA